MPRAGHSNFQITISRQLRKKIDWLKESGVDPFDYIRAGMNKSCNELILQIKEKLAEDDEAEEIIEEYPEGINEFT